MAFTPLQRERRDGSEVRRSGLAHVEAELKPSNFMRKGRSPSLQPQRGCDQAQGWSVCGPTLECKRVTLFNPKGVAAQMTFLALRHGGRNPFGVD